MYGHLKANLNEKNGVFNFASIILGFAFVNEIGFLSFLGRLSFDLTDCPFIYADCPLILPIDLNAADIYEI